LALIRSGFPFNRVNPLPPVEGRFAGCLYPVRNNAPLVCSGVTHFRIIPAGFNAPLEFLTGFTHLEGCIGKHLSLTF